MLHLLHRFRHGFALGLMLAAVAASPAAAMVDRGSVGPASHPAARSSTNLCAEVCFGGGGGLVARTSSSASPPRTVIRVIERDDGFAWGDAAIGGAVIAGVFLIVGGAGAAIARRAGRLGRSGASVAT